MVKPTPKKLTVRNAVIADIDQIIALTRKVYPGMPPYSPDMVRGQLTNYPDGQFVAFFGDQMVGFCATFRISGEIALKAHTWKEITGSGFGSRHDPNGDWLYGMEVCVDPDYRGWRIGKRLYNERKRLCKYLHLKGIVFAGRMPQLATRLKRVGSPEAYVERVKAKKIRDRVLLFQMRNGFDIIGVIPDYLPSDKESLGYAAHMVWRNPQVPDETPAQKKARLRISDSVRVSVVQYKQRRVQSFEEFCDYVEYFVDVVAGYDSDFCVFPELFTMQLLSIENRHISPTQAITALTAYTDQVVKFLREMAVQYNVNIIGGSHPTLIGDGVVHNISYVCLRDGTIHEQAKIHPTPNERYWWNVQGGRELKTIQTDCGPIGVLICYDAEFPELGRHLANQGVQLIFVPFCTDERQSYLRVRYCAQARAVENQAYVALAGNVGNLPGVENMDVQYSQSCILTPCDFPFARDGIAADTSPNVETVAIADLNLSSLSSARNSGTVTNLKDRRFDLYEVAWKADSITPTPAAGKPRDGMKKPSAPQEK